jgi:hypothetical protein
MISGYFLRNAEQRMVFEKSFQSIDPHSSNSLDAGL